MKIDLKKLRQEGKDSESFYFEYTPDDAILTIPAVRFAAPVKIVGEVGIISKSEAFVRADLTITLVGACNRCLSEAERTYVCTLDEDFVSDESDELYTYRNDLLDLTKAVTDKILLELPIVFLCREDCKGLCPVCGKDRNEGDCGCQA